MLHSHRQQTADREARRLKEVLAAQIDRTERTKTSQLKTRFPEKHHTGL